MLEVVGKTFKKHILQAKRPVLIEMYSPDCIHCKTLATQWELLAKGFKAAGTSVTVVCKLDFIHFPAVPSVQSTSCVDWIVNNLREVLRCIAVECRPSWT